MRDLDLRDVRVFVRVARLESFAAAAKSLRLARSSVSRSIARLEAHLGTQLLRRTPRALVLTPEGRRYFDYVSPALEVIESATHDATSSEHPSGTVRLVVPPGLGAETLPDIIAEFVRAYPDVSVEVDIDPEQGDLVDGEYDLAIRGGPQPDSALIMRKLLDSPFRLFASPDYVAIAGAPEAPEDLAKHTCVLFKGKRDWVLSGPDGDVEVKVSGSVSSNGLTFVTQAAIAGMGVALLPEVPGRRAVERGALVPLLEEYGLRGSPLYLIHSSSEHLPTRVRLLRTFLLDAFREFAPDEVDT